MITSIIKLVEHKTSSDDTKFSNEEYEKNAKELSGLKLETKEDQKLKEFLKEKKILSIKELKSGLEISPSSYVGKIQFSNFAVQVSPKYSLDEGNLRKLLDYVLPLKPKMVFVESAIDVEADQRDLLLDIVINSLIFQCNQLLKQGLMKSYVVHEENVPFLRGKLMMKQQIQNTMKNNVKFACQYDELEQDNLENRILLAALGASHNITKNEELKRNLRMLMHQFDLVVSRTPISIHDFDKISYNRLNQHYEAAHNLSRLILKSSGFKEYRSEKKIKIKPFFIDMDDVFEKFVEKLFRFYYAHAYNYSVKAQKTTKAWESDSFNDKNMRTDILVSDSKDATKKFILDTKYKEKLSPEDRYQIGFYIHEYKQNQGTALLPEFNDNTEEVLTSVEKKIVINVKRININKILELIYDKKDEVGLHNEINKIIRTDMQVSFK